MPDTNEDVIDTLYRLYEQPIYFEAYKILHDEYLAEDAVHEAFVRLIRNRDKIVDAESPAVRRYVYKTVKSAALDLYRRQKKHRERCLVFDESIENTMVFEDEKLEIMPLSLIADLPPKYASVMRCLFIYGLSIRETSAVLKISEGLVRKRCERARKLLKGNTVYTEKEIHYGE